MIPAQRQARPITLALAANLLLWGWSIPLPVGSIGLNVLVTLLCGWAIRGPRRQVSLRPLAFTALGLAYGLALFVVAGGREGLEKVVFSAGLFLLTSVAISRLVDRTDFSRPLFRQRDLERLVMLVAGAAVLEFGLKAASGYTSHAMVDEGLRVGGLFREPSHLALSMCPVLFLLWVQTPWARARKLAVATGCLLLCSPSSTFLLFAVALAGVYRLAKVDSWRRAFRQGPKFALAAALALAGLQLPVAESLRTRLTGVMSFESDPNLSSVVYVNGWLLMDGYLRQTRGLGVGFNAMGLLHRPETLVTPILTRWELEDQNATDGSFILSKLTSEFGWLGMVLWGGFLWAAWKVLKSHLRGERWATASNGLMLFGLLAMISLAGLIRSAGYFSGPFLAGWFGWYAALSKPLTEAGEGSPRGGLSC